uniref:Ferredoxin n=1 Tax=uncultured bacterium contig00056 TaxID=1181540 RepID=A0A806KCD1_9BACT|nr:ferredoxin [uncultured bacterium contig00056]
MRVPDDGMAVVYMTKSITPEGLLAVYEALGLEARGDVAVKISTGEPGNPHYLAPTLIKELVQKVNGTIVECNTAYGGRRASTAVHYQVAKDHGFTAIAPVVIMDETEDMGISVTGGKHLRENFVGARFGEFSFHIVLSHFKGHGMGGFGGALKNLSIGYASSAGKNWIHSGGKSKTSMRGAQDDFLESMAEAAKSVVDANKGRILYINVMNHLSVDCDCNGKPAAPTMADIGILASLDPVALDQACVDLVYAAKDSADLIQRIESRNGLLTIEHAQKIGLGSKEYLLINIEPVALPARVAAAQPTTVSQIASVR